MMEEHVGGMVCKCPHHKMPGMLIMLFGLLFLGGNFGWWGMGVVNVGWPVLVILAGLMHFGKGWCKCC